MAQPKQIQAELVRARTLTFPGPVIADPIQPGNPGGPTAPHIVLSPIAASGLKTTGVQLLFPLGPVELTGEVFRVWKQELASGYWGVLLTISDYAPAGFPEWITVCDLNACGLYFQSLGQEPVDPLKVCVEEFGTCPP